MGKKSKNTDTTNSTTDTNQSEVTTSQKDEKKKENNNDDDDIPADLLEYKKELESRTGKKYKYRKAKKDLPSVGEILAHGNEGKTWKEIIILPIILAILFAITLYIFHHTILTRPSSQKPLTLPRLTKKPPLNNNNNQNNHNMKSSSDATEKEEF